MTQREEQLLLIDLCARVPYGVKIQRNSSYDFTKKIVERFDAKDSIADLTYKTIERFEYKPFLRPMSSMTEEELKMFRQLQVEADEAGTFEGDMLLYDWLNKNRFDYRLLIFQGLALEAPVDMYKTE